MAEVIRGKNEPLDSLLRRFNRTVQDAGIPAEASRRAYYEKPSDRKRRKRMKAERRRKRQESVQIQKAGR